MVTSGMVRTLGCLLAFVASIAVGIAYPAHQFQLLSDNFSTQLLAPAAGHLNQSAYGVAREGGGGLTSNGAVTAVWANDGGDKVTQDELRTVTGVRPVVNRLWDGSTVHLFGARNEMLGFNLVLEAAHGPASSVAVSFAALAGPNNFRIQSKSTDRDGVFSWVDRNIELFLVRYLTIAGLSRLSYETYDEDHVPKRMRLPASNAKKAWADRPDHDKEYPDIAVPIELAQTFEIAERRNQSIWVDVYIPKDSPAGIYSGTIEIRERDDVKYRVPVELRVRDFALPDIPTSKTMVATSYHEVAKRYTGNADPTPGSPEDLLTKRVMDRQMMEAHRHKLSLIDDNGGAAAWPYDRPRPEWEPRLSGSLFTPANGYRGPGEGVGNGVFSIGIYGEWRARWGEPTRELMSTKTSRWESWFAQNASHTERFLYLADESEAYDELERLAQWMRRGQESHSGVCSFATVDLVKAQGRLPSLDIFASWFRVGDTEKWQQALAKLHSNGKKLYLYNGHRPASGSFAIEDDGVALRELAWGQYKKDVDRWFFWNATYYNDYQGGRGPTNVFKNAQTFGGKPHRDASLGLTGWNYSNGDGVLFYPGTDEAYPDESYNLAGPIASLRLKHWRRGIQDVDYLALAAQVDPAATKAIVDRMVPKVLWEYGFTDPADPTWVRAPISWSIDPDDWETARAQLADIIEGGDRKSVAKPDGG